MKFEDIVVKHKKHGEIKLTIKRIAIIDYIKMGAYKSRLTSGMVELDQMTAATLDLLAMLHVCVVSELPDWCDFENFIESEDLEFLKDVFEKVQEFQNFPRDKHDKEKGNPKQ